MPFPVEFFDHMKENEHLYLLIFVVLRIPIGGISLLYLLRFAVLRFPIGKNNQLYLLRFAVLRFPIGKNKPTLPIEICGITDSNRWN